MNPFETLVEHCNESHPHMKSPRGQIDISKAKAEHSALCAIRDAAEHDRKTRQGTACAVSSKLVEALATLAKLRS